jgi:galactokinase
MKNKLLEIHHKLYPNSQDIRIFFAPGRVNLIGEHIDYNGGYVFPFAINLGSYAAVSKRSDTKIFVSSQQFSNSDVLSFDLNTSFIKDPHQSWINYIKGMFDVFKKNQFILPHGLNISIGADIPFGAGLSSSASLEMLIATIINNVYKFNVKPQTLASWGKIVENDYVGVSCGIMDQFASIMCKQNQALLLNSNTLFYELVDFKVNDYEIVLINSNKKRTLEHSKYNERVGECQTALNQINQKNNFKYLCQLSLTEFEQFKSLISNPIVVKRARHVISENQRVIEAVKCLKANDLISFGNLLNASHLSLKNDYEVTGFELDTLVETAWNEKSCIGSRMTGAGFGGCTISVVAKDQTQEFIKNVGSNYLAKTGLKADFYIVHPADSAKEL